jgi:hypothetical protein
VTRRAGAPTRIDREEMHLGEKAETQRTGSVPRRSSPLGPQQLGGLAGKPREAKKRGGGLQVGN